MTTVPTPENHRPATQFYILALVVAIAIAVIGVLAFGLTRDPRAIPSPLIGCAARQGHDRKFLGLVVLPRLL